MPVETELSPDQIDELRQETTIHELEEQGGITPLADNPFAPEHAMNLSPEEKKKLTLAHDYRDARKLQYVINRGDLTTAEVSAASAWEVQTMIEENFESKFNLPLRKPHQDEIVEEKEEGHYAEDALVKMFDEVDLGHPVHAELGSDYLDGIAKTDIALFITVGAGQEILLKVQTKNKAKEEDIKKIPKNALLVEVTKIPLPKELKLKMPGKTNYDNGMVIDIANTGTPGDKKLFVSLYYLEICRALLKTLPDTYREAKRALHIQ